MPSRKENIRRKSTIVYLMSVFGLISMLVTLTFFFKIRKIVCLVEADSFLDVDAREDPELCRQVDFLLKESLFYTIFENSALYTQIFNNDLGQVFLPEKISKQLPDTLIIIFKKEDPLYRIESFQDDTFLVNSKGYLMQDIDEFELPLVILDEQYQFLFELDKINSQLNQTIFSLVIALKQAGVKYETITLSGTESRISTSSNEFLFTDSDDFIKLAYEIKSVEDGIQSVEEELPQGTSIKVIDMRFDLPVVKYE